MGQLKQKLNHCSNFDELNAIKEQIAAAEQNISTSKAAYFNMTGKTYTPPAKPSTTKIPEKTSMPQSRKGTTRTSNGIGKTKMPMRG